MTTSIQFNFFSILKRKSNSAHTFSSLDSERKVQNDFEEGDIEKEREREIDKERKIERESEKSEKSEKEGWKKREREWEKERGFER